VLERFRLRSLSAKASANRADSTEGPPRALGEEGYAITKLEGAGLRVISKGLGSAGVEDPLDQRQSIGWKITGFGAKVINSNAVVNYFSIPKFDTATSDFVDSPREYTITFSPVTTAPGEYQIGRTTVKLAVGEGYTYGDAIALAGVAAPGTIQYWLAAAGTTAVDKTAALSADDVIYIKVV
jgi:hypothetical protein